MKYENHVMEVVVFDNCDLVMTFSTPGGTVSPWSVPEDEPSDI